MVTKRLFNPDAVEDSQIIGGDTSNLLYLNGSKYQWAISIYKVMRQNFWTPELIDLTGDKLEYSRLTEEEAVAYSELLSFLIFLDSLQTNNLPNVVDYITAPEIVLALSEQTSQEGLHSFSYQTVLESAVPADKVDEIYYYWKKDPILLARITKIAGVYQDFADDPNIKNYIRMLIADLLLEGLYFYNGFMFFYALASRGLMVGTADMIRRIHTDELTHVALFSNILTTLYHEHPDLRELIKGETYKLTTEAVVAECEWSEHIIGDKILGFNKEALRENAQYLANKNVFKRLGFESPFPDAQNVFKHLDRVASVEDTSSNRGNFFEGNSNNYQQAKGSSGMW